MEVTGLELSRTFFRDCVLPILTTHFPDQRFAAARIGKGSEVLGYDDAMSRDHDWGPRLSLLLPQDDVEAGVDKAIDSALRSHLPPSVCGYSTSFSEPDPNDNGVQGLAEVGQGDDVNHRVDIHGIEDYIRDTIGVTRVNDMAPRDWLVVPQQRLLAFTAGAVFHDDLPTLASDGRGEEAEDGSKGALMVARDALAYFPHDVWLYLMAANWARLLQEQHLMGRAGFGPHGSNLGAAVIAGRLVRDCMNLAFLQARVYAPYAKWFGRAFASLPPPVDGTDLEAELHAVLSVSTWEEREEHLTTVYSSLAKSHNALGVTAPFSTETTPFFGRPFQVIGHPGEDQSGGGDVVGCFEDAIVGEEVKAWLAKDSSSFRRVMFGSVDTFSDSVDFVEGSVGVRDVLLDLYST